MAGGNPPAALDLRAQIEEDYLTCQICQGPYCRPKALACLHSFCAHCLQEYVCSKRVAPGGRFECPVCRKPMALPRPGVSGLPDNHVLVSLADTMRRVEATAGLRDEAPGPPRGSPPRHGAGRQNSEDDFSGILDAAEPAANSHNAPAGSGPEPEMGRAPGSQPEVMGRARRQSAQSDRVSINRLKDVQRQEVLELLRCLSSITDHIHTPRDLTSGHVTPRDLAPRGLDTEEGGPGSRSPRLTVSLEDEPRSRSPRRHLYSREMQGSTHRLGAAGGGGALDLSSASTAGPRSHGYPPPPATPSHLQLRLDDPVQTPVARQTSRSPVWRSEATPQGTLTTPSLRHSPSRSRDAGSTDPSPLPAAPGFYPAVQDGTHSTESPGNRIIRSNPVPIKTLGQFGSGLFDLNTPIGLTTPPDGGTVLVSDQHGSRVLVYDLESGVTSGCLRCEGDIRDVAISTMGHVLVATHDDAGSGLAVAYTLDGHKIASLGRQVALEEHAHGISASSHHHVAVTCLSGAVYVLNENGQVLHEFGKRGRDLTLLATPYYVTFNQRGQLLISDCDANSVKVYDCAGQFQFSFGGSHAESRELSRPSGICVDPNDNVIVCDFGTGAVKLFTPDGKFLKSIVKYPQNVGPELVARPLNVALSGGGAEQLLVLVRGSHFAQVQVFEYNVDFLRAEPKSSICCVS